MDYIYANMCKSVQKVEYKGSETDTAVVCIDQRTNRVSVNVKQLSPSKLIPQVGTELTDYVLLATVTEEGVAYKWVTSEVANSAIEEAIEELGLKITEESDAVNEILAKYNEDLTAAIAVETTRATKAEEVLQASIDETEASLIKQVEAETSRAVAAEATLNTIISAAQVEAMEAAQQAREAASTAEAAVAEIETLAANMKYAESADVDELFE